MRDYFKRVITFDPNTQLYTCECPEIGLKEISDTEMSVLVDMRKLIEREAPRLAKRGSAPLPTPGASEKEAQLLEDAIDSFRYLTQSGRRAGKSSRYLKDCPDCGRRMLPQNHPRGPCGVPF